VGSKLLEEASNPDPYLCILVENANLVDTLLGSTPEGGNPKECLMNERLELDIDALAKDTTCNEHDYDRDTAFVSHRKANIYGRNNSYDDYSDGEFDFSSEYNFQSDTGLCCSSPESDSTSYSTSDSE
jgi:hypothetical protein